MFIKQETLRELKSKIWDLEFKNFHLESEIKLLEKKIEALEKYWKVQYYDESTFGYKPIKLEDRND